MALINALQNNSQESFHPPSGGSVNRFMTIRSIWPFPVTGIQLPEDSDTVLPNEDTDESGTASSFVT